MKKTLIIFTSILFLKSCSPEPCKCVEDIQQILDQGMFITSERNAENGVYCVKHYTDFDITKVSFDEMDSYKKRKYREAIRKAKRDCNN